MGPSDGDGELLPLSLDEAEPYIAHKSSERQKVTAEIGETDGLGTQSSSGLQSGLMQHSAIVGISEAALSDYLSIGKRISPTTRIQHSELA